MAIQTHEEFVADQKRPTPPVVKVDLTGKVVVVVGANTGMGFEAAKHFAEMNPARLILTCRSVEKGDDARDRIREATKFQNVESWVLDLSTFASVISFADKFNKEVDRLDLLVQNAAVVNPGYTVTEDGWETTVQVNDLSLQLLALLLLPKIVQTAKQSPSVPRITVVSSINHQARSLEKSLTDSSDNIWKTFSSKEYCTPSIMQGRYPDSKMLNIFFVRALQKRLPSVIVNAINPGFCISNLRRSITDPKMTATFAKMESDFGIPTEEGSRHIVYGAVGGADAEDKLRGAFISLSRLEEVGDYVLSEDGKIAEEKLWNDMLQVLSEVEPNVRTIVEEYLA